MSRCFPPLFWCKRIASLGVWWGMVIMGWVVGIKERFRREHIVLPSHILLLYHP